MPVIIRRGPQGVRGARHTQFRAVRDPFAWQGPADARERVRVGTLRAPAAPPPRGVASPAQLARPLAGGTLAMAPPHAQRAPGGPVPVGAIVARGRVVSTMQTRGEAVSRAVGRAPVAAPAMLAPRNSAAYTQRHRWLDTVRKHRAARGGARCECRDCRAAVARLLVRAPKGGNV